MTITAEQRRYAQLAGIVFLLKIALELGGDVVTIIARSGSSFAEKARFVTESAMLWRVSLLEVGLAWIASAFLAVGLYAVLEPVNKRLAQLAMVLRVGTSFVGAASLMFRVAQARIYEASATEGLFTTEQLRTLVAVAQRGANSGITTAWMFLGAANVLTFALFLRSRYLPRALAGAGIATSALLILVAVLTVVLPERTNELKALLIPALLVEITTALWLVMRGLHPRAAPEAQV